MENDDGTLQQYAKFGEELFRSNFFNEIKTNLNAGNSSDIKKILARIAGTYSLKNSDEWIGSFVCAFLLSREGVKENYGAVFNENNPPTKCMVQIQRTIQKQQAIILVATAHLTLRN